jgi:hypothetical protein
MENIGGKLVCSQCYHVLDSAPGAAPRMQAGTAEQAPAVTLSKDPNAPLPLITSPPPAPLASRPCPKCGGEATDAGGRLVCNKCYWVMDAAPAQSLTMQPSASTNLGSSMQQMAIALVVIFMIILFAMVQWMNHHPEAATNGLTGTSTNTSTTTSPGQRPASTLPGTPVQPSNSLPGTPVQPQQPGQQPPH